MTVKRVFRTVLPQTPGGREGWAILVLFLLLLPLFLLFPHGPDRPSPPGGWPILLEIREIPPDIQNPLIDVNRQVDTLQCLHVSVPGDRSDSSWECRHGKKSGICVSAAPSALPSEEGLFVPPAFCPGWIRTQNRSPNDGPSRPSPPPRSRLV